MSEIESVPKIESMFRRITRKFPTGKMVEEFEKQNLFIKKA